MFNLFAQIRSNNLQRNRSRLQLSSLHLAFLFSLRGLTTLNKSHPTTFLRTVFQVPTQLFWLRFLLSISSFLRNSSCRLSRPGVVFYTHQNLCQRPSVYFFKFLANFLLSPSFCRLYFFFIGGKYNGYFGKLALTHLVDVRGGICDGLLLVSDGLIIDFYRALLNHPHGF